MKNIFFISIMIIVTLTHCKKEEGCTDPIAINYNSSAKINNGTCNYIYGCTDPTAKNYGISATKDDGSCTYEGSVVFWQHPSSGFATTTVTVNGISEQITQDKSTTPSCGESGTATFTLDVGIYNYTATETGLFGATWAGSFVILTNDCSTKQLIP